MSERDALRMCVDAAEFSMLRYAQRQLIVVVDDAVIKTELRLREEALRRAAKRLAANKKEDEDDDPIWEEVLHRVRRSKPSIDISSLPIVEGLADSRSKDDEISVLTVGYSTAQSLVFPPGHPRNEVLYVGHPVVPQVYYTAANFHRLTFEHKFSEALQLLMALGATRVTVERISGWLRDFDVNTDAPLKVVKGKAKVERSRSVDSRIFFDAHLEGAEQPNLPEKMVWYPYEPTWQAIADGRLKYGIKNFKLIIEYADDFNVNLHLSLNAMKAGLNLGGKFTDFQATEWHMDGEFPDNI